MSSLEDVLARVTLVPGLDGEPEAPSDLLLPEHPSPAATWHLGRGADGEALLVFVVRGPHAADAADASRRAALVTDPSLAEIVEVLESTDADGQPISLTLVADPGVSSLADMAADQALRAETARTIAGRTAQALELARRKGITHRLLDERRVFVDVESDRVVLIGAGIEAAALTEGELVALSAGEGIGHGQGEPGAVDPDARGLGRVLFVALTGRDSSFFGGPDVVDPRLVSARTVPEDLAAITRTALTYTAAQTGDPVYEVQDIEADLTPWQSLPVTLEAFDPEQHAPAPQPLSAERLEEIRHPAGAAENAVTPDTATIEPGASVPGAPESGAPESEAADSGAAESGASDASEPGAAESEAAEPAESGADSGANADGAAGAHGAAGAAGAAGAVGAGDRWGDAVVGSTRHSSRSDATAGLDEDTARMIAATGPLRIAGRTTSMAEELDEDEVLDEHGEPVVADADPTGAEPADAQIIPINADADTVAARRPAIVPPSAVPASEEQSDEPTPAILIPGRQHSLTEQPGPDANLDDDQGSSSLLRDVVGVAMASDEPRHLGTSGGGGNRARIILIAAAVLAALCLFLAINNLTSVGREREVSTTPKENASAAASPSADASPAAAEDTADAAPAVKPELTDIAIVYPEDPAKADKPERAERINNGGAWTTQRYNSSSYGGLRNGMGIELSLKEKAPVSEVVVTGGTGDGGNVELRTVGPNGEPGDVLANAPFKGSEPVSLKPEKPVDADKVMLWITELPPADGGFRAEVSAIEVK